MTGLVKEERTKGSIKSNALWGVLGNILYQASQWLLLVLLTKLATTHDVGEFAFALAVCTPITTFLSLGLRNVQIVGMGEEMRFGVFLALRLVCAIIVLILVFAIAVAGPFSYETKWIVIAVAIAQVALMVREPFTAFLQKHERMDLFSVLHASVGLLSVTAFGVTLWLVQDVVWSCIAMAGARLSMLVCGDMPTTRHVAIQLGKNNCFAPVFSLSLLRRLAWTGFPIGVTSVLTSLIENAPKYVISACLGAPALGIFTPFAALAQAGRLVTTSVGLSALPRLSLLNEQRERAEFSILLAQMVGAMAMFGLACFALGYFIGPGLLTFVFSEEYAEHFELFLWIMGYCVVAYIAATLNYGLLAAKKFWLQPIIYSAVLAVAVVATLCLVPQCGLNGAAIALILARAFQALFISVVLCLIDRPSSTTNSVAPS